MVIQTFSDAKIILFSWSMAFRDTSIRALSSLANLVKGWKNSQLNVGRGSKGLLFAARMPSPDHPVLSAMQGGHERLFLA